MAPSSSNTWIPTSDRTADHRRLLVSELTAAGRRLGISPNLKRDLKHYDESDRKEIWRRIREFYHQHVLSRAPQIALKQNKKIIRCEDRKEEAWVFNLSGDHRIGVQYRDETLIVRRVGPHTGKRRIYP